jgi:hypothetical protein
MAIFNDYDDLDEDEDECEDGDVKRCKNCGKMCPQDDLCYINGSFGEMITVCPQCARSISFSEDSYSEE